MRNATAGLIMSAMLLLATAVKTQAQTVFGSAGVSSLWDDETFLGRGVTISGGVAQPLGRHLAIEGELSGTRHLRDAGCLAADGTALTGTGRLAFLFQPPESRARAFVSAGLAIVHSTGTLTTRSTVRGANGLPIEGPSAERGWSLTQPAFELGTGVSIAVSPRMAIRPELRWISTRGTASSRSTIEPPIWSIRGGVAVAWRLR